PLKYPDMFAAASLMILNKIDLLPHLRFDVARCIEYARQVNPHLQVLQLSAATGEGVDEWLDWMLAGGAAAGAAAATDGARMRIAAPEAGIAALGTQLAPGPAVSKEM
ncbi:hydrogenase nickel incorporation protein HypB, partial [Escherichia coli]